MNVLFLKLAFHCPFGVTCGSSNLIKVTIDLVVKHLIVLAFGVDGSLRHVLTPQDLGTCHARGGVWHDPREH